jgi:hypothetical protein
MAGAIITVEISTAIRSALSVVVPAGTVVYAHGVMTDVEGYAQEVDRMERKMPCVDIIPGERVPNGYASVLRQFPCRIRVMTWYPDDPFQIGLYTLANAVSEWICGPPSLTLASTHFDALVCESAPETGNFGENGYGQYMEWNTLIRTRK